MPVTLKHVAQLAGVSSSAVSRAFTEGASVSAKTRKKVETAAATLGYHPNVLASSLTTGRTKLIGLVSNNFHNPVFLEIFDLFTRGLQQRGLRPLLVNLSDEKSPDHSVRMLKQYSVDGVILASSTLPPNFATAYRNAGLPIVHSFGRSTRTPKVHIVGVDNRECGRLAAQTFIDRGYKSVAFLGGPETATTTQDRLYGFMERCAEHSTVRMSHSFATAYSFEAGRSEMQRLLRGKPAEAYFCGDDVLAIGALSAIRETRLRIPEDIGVLGFNDMEMARWENIALTTIRQPISEIIDTSIETALSMLNMPDHKPSARLFTCQLVERSTLRKI